ncbi:MAG: C4-dicarboxylate ABC transporter substrate-binding protein [Proteobacteria bacterium]|nr:C4-dicarboxylate ABC transporter substrate-binding protein [Pseudomonadota bacterium]
MSTEQKRKMFRVPVRGERLSLRDMFMAWWPALLVVAIGFAVAWQFVEPAPPRSVVMVTGAEDGAYFAFAKQYGEVLARNDIELEIRSTSGSVENYHLLKAEDSDVDFGFVHGGIGKAEDAPDLLSLGGMYYEPVWVFHRLGTRIERLTQLKGRRIAIGPLGSGTRRLAASLLVASGVPIPHGPVADLTGDAAVRALQEGRADVVVLVASPQSRAVNALLRDRRVQLVSFSHAEAYTRHFPHLAAIVLPKGGIDLKLDIPPQDVRLVATTADLVVRDDLHPAVVGLLAEAAAEVHGRPGLFQRAHEFPSSLDVDFPMSADAARYYKSGAPFLQRYLPFWAANFVDRMIVLLVPVIALVIPLFRLLPALYHWRIRSRIYRQYGELKFLEDEVINQPAADKVRDYLARLDSIEDRVNKLRIPLAYHEQMYTLRGHIDLVRAYIARLASA